MNHDSTPNVAQPKSHRRWYQFGLRTLLIGVTLLSVLFSQWPLVERGPPEHRTEPSELFFSDSPKAVLERIRPELVKIGEGAYYVPDRIVVVGSIEAAALIGWVIWRRLRAKPCTQS